MFDKPTQPFVRILYIHLTIQKQQQRQNTALLSKFILLPYRPIPQQ